MIHLSINRNLISYIMVAASSEQLNASSEQSTQAANQVALSIIE